MADSMTSSLFQPSSLPQFASKIDEKYICIKCKSLLSRPVKQTLCGHRMCGDCIKDLLQSSTSTICPGGEPDCIDISDASNVYPDFGTEKEMNKLKVFCSNKDFGCKEVLQWSKLKDHVAECPYSPVDCPNQRFGCKLRIGRVNLETHVESECNYKAIRCRHCGRDIPKREMDSGHEEQCARSPKECKFKSMGCQFSGSKEELEVHLNDHVKHIEILMGSIAEMQLNETKLRAQLQELRNENDILHNKVEESTKDTKKLKAQYETKIKNLQKMTAGNAEKIINLQKLEEPARKLSSLQDLSRIHESRITTLESRQGSGAVGVPEGLTNSIKSLESSIGMHDIRLAEYDLRFQCIETGSFDGVLVWKISDYNRRKTEAVSGRTLSLYSQPFYTSRFGYKMCARVYLNGDGMGKGTHLSLFFVIMKGDYDALLPWPFRQKVTLSLMDQTSGRHNLTDTFRPDPTSTSFKRPTAEMNVASGCPLFVTHSALEERSYLKDDTIFIKVAVDTSDLGFP